MTTPPTLRIGVTADRRPFSLPLQLITETLVILARKGKGKSYLGAVIAEEIMQSGHVPCIIDPTGAHWGLKAGAEAGTSGYKIVIFGGKHADVPLEPAAGDVIAQAIIEHRFAAILDLSLLRKGEMQRFLTGFLETLYRLNTEPLHLICDEADAFAPQKPFADQARTLGAMEDIVRRGRIRGIGCTLITQRPQVLNKDVLTQATVLVALGMNHPRDLGAIEEWVAVHGDPVKAKAMIASLPSLERGTAWFWAPDFGDIFEKVQIRPRMTFDSGRTPKPGEKLVAPRNLTPVDVALLGAKIEETVKRAKENDPAVLKAEVSRLRAELAKKPAATPAERIEIPILSSSNESELKNVATAISNLELRVAAQLQSITDLAVSVNKIRNDVAPIQVSFTQQRPFFSTKEAAMEARLTSNRADSKASGWTMTPPKSEPLTVVERTVSTERVGNSGMRRMMIAIAQRPGMNRRQVAIRAGMSCNSGTFSTYLAKMRTSGWLNEDDGMELTEAGLASLGTYQPLPEGPELLRYWLNELGGGAARILQVLAEAHPVGLSRDAVARQAEMSANSGTFSTYLSKLRTLELIEGREKLTASAELF